MFNWIRVRRGSVLVLALLLLISVVRAQDVAPTIVPPTPIPVGSAGANDSLVETSALVRIQAEGRVRIGILYNEPPFGELNIRGEVVGYDASLGRSMAEAWGVEAEFIQVTRQTALEQLLSAQVDMLLAARVHRREFDEQLEFSQTYYIGSQAMLVRLDDGAQSLGEMANRRVGVVMGAESESAVAYWQERNGIAVSVQRYLTYDQAVVALMANEVDGVVDKRYRLRNTLDPDRMRILDGEVQPEPYAIAFRRQDVNLRNLVNHTLQYLAQTGRLAEIHAEFFPFRAYPVDTVPIWAGVGESAPQLSLYDMPITYPQQYAAARVLSDRVVRVAGIPQPIPQSPEADRRIAQANSALVQAMAARWGVSVQFLTSTEDPLALVERGEADLAVGVMPNWNAVNRVDFTGSYLLRGKRMLVEVDQSYESFSDLRGKWVGVFATEPGTADLVNSLASSVNASVNIFTVTRDEDAAYELLVEDNIDVVFGDSVRLLPHLEANAGQLKFSERCQTCDAWYTREYMALAVPRNDLDFRLLVEYTLQEMYQDGVFNTVLAGAYVPGYELSYEVWPGSSVYLGVSLR